MTHTDSRKTDKSSSGPRAGGVNWRSVALPTEHGGWGFISEPILLGLLLAPSVCGCALSITAFAAFLLRQPLKLYLKDLRAGRVVPRTLAARRFALIYGSIMLIAGLITLLTMPIPMILLPLILALPLLAVQLWQDVRGKGRGLLAELIGAMAPGAIASSIVLIQGWDLFPALGLWLALAIKGVTAVLYVRARLRLERGKETAIGVAVAAHLIGLLILVTLSAINLLPWTAPFAMAILLVRAALGLSYLRKLRPAKIIGMQEMAYGIGFVVLMAFGYMLA